MDFLNHVIVLLGLAVLASVQVLKFIRLNATSFANRYPVATNIVASIVAVLIAAKTDHLNPVGWTQWLTAVALCSLTAAILYNQLIGKSPAVQALQAKGYVAKGGK